MLEHETLYWNKGYWYIAGLDEVGYGAIAGPVTAAAVVLAPGAMIAGVRDSKQVHSVKEREHLFDRIHKHALDIGVGFCSPQEIDEINILQAALKAMRRAIGKLEKCKPQHLLIDGIHRLPDPPCSQTTVKGGDSLSLTIAAASIIAKVTRDRIMRNLHLEHPEYGWSTNVGYKSVKHKEAVRKYGPTRHHRRSFTLN